jgi:hypothetical protein
MTLAAVGRKNIPMSELLMDGADFGSRRRAAGITGQLVCQCAGLSRARLSAYERGYTMLPDDEQSRVEKALAELMEAKRKMAATAVECGWPVSAL